MSRAGEAAPRSPPFATCAGPGSWSAGSERGATPYPHGRTDPAPLGRAPSPNDFPPPVALMAGEGRHQWPTGTTHVGISRPPAPVHGLGIGGRGLGKEVERVRSGSARWPKDDAPSRERRSRRAACGGCSAHATAPGRSAPSGPSRPLQIRRRRPPSTCRIPLSSPCRMVPANSEPPVSL